VLVRRGVRGRALGAPGVLLTTSCTHALEMSALLLDLAPGDEVIVPSFTFVTSASAFALRGARPVFADIRPDTLNLDHEALPSLITERTRAIVAVHYAGVGCELDALAELAEERGLALIEDNAHGLFGRYRGQWLGTRGRFATQSFHETKNFTCGEGGALVLNRAEDVQRAEILREKGTNRARFFRGEVDKYTWVDLGSSYVPSDVLAAMLFAQLERRDEIQRGRARLWERYRDALAGWADDVAARLPVIPPHCEQAFHMFYVLLPSGAERDRFLAHLKARGILAVFHYLPLHLSEFGRRVGGAEARCPVTVDVSERLARLPFFGGMTDEEQDRVIEAVLAFEA
jgi:dTDP-4-amino-4,6-dideoxygalactose transaminase